MATARSFGGGTTTTRVAAAVTAMDSGDWTIAVWLNPTNAGQTGAAQAVNVNDAGDTGPRQLLRFNGTGTALEVRQAATVNTSCLTSTQLATGVWQCVIGTFRNSDLKCRCYIGDQATLVAEASYSSNVGLSGTRSTGGNVANFGTNVSSTATFLGAIGPVVIDAREWSLADMEFFRQEGQPPSFASLRGWWPMTGTRSDEPNLAGLAAAGTVTAPNSPAFTTGPRLWLRRTARPRRLMRV